MERRGVGGGGTTGTGQKRINNGARASRGGARNPGENDRCRVSRRFIFHRDRTADYELLMAFPATAADSVTDVCERTSSLLPGPSAN